MSDSRTQSSTSINEGDVSRVQVVQQLLQIGLVLALQQAFEDFGVFGFARLLTVDQVFEHFLPTASSGSRRRGVAGEGGEASAFIR